MTLHADERYRITARIEKAKRRIARAKIEGVITEEQKRIDRLSKLLAKDAEERSNA